MKPKDSVKTQLTDKIEAYVVGDFVRVYGAGWQLTILNNNLGEKSLLIFWPGGPETWVVVEHGNLEVSLRDYGSGETMGMLKHRFDE